MKTILIVIAIVLIPVISFAVRIPNNLGVDWRTDNTNLNFFEVIGYALLICSFLMIAAGKQELIHLPKWAAIPVATTAIAFLWIGDYKKNKKV